MFTRVRQPALQLVVPLRVASSESEGLHDRIRQRPTRSLWSGAIISHCSPHMRSGSAVIALRIQSRKSSLTAGAEDQAPLG
jgi:hypothetical protein